MTEDDKKIMARMEAFAETLALVVAASGLSVTAVICGSLSTGQVKFFGDLTEDCSDTILECARAVNGVLKGSVLR